MKLQTKALTHYIINTSIVIITIAALILGISMQSGVGRAKLLSISFFSLFIVTWGSLFITSILLGNDHSKPIRALFPTFLCSLLLTFIGTLVVTSYHAFFKMGSTYSTFLYHYPFLFIVLLILAFIYIAMFMSINIYITKFCMSSTAGNIGSEWIVRNFTSLVMNKADIVNSKEFTYIYSKGKLMVSKFITEDEDQRLVVFEEDERNAKSSLINSMEEELSKLDNLEAKKYFVIVYLSNKIPNTKGKSKDIILIKNKDLFNEYKKLEANDINKDIIEERLK